MGKVAYFDISGLLALLHGENSVLTLLETYRDFYTGALAVAQLISIDEAVLGAKDLNEKRINGLIRSLKVMEVTQDDAEQAGKLIGSMKSAGKDIYADEAISAVQASRMGLTLVTRNSNFKKIKKKKDLKLDLKFV